MAHLISHDNFKWHLRLSCIPITHPTAYAYADAVVAVWHKRWITLDMCPWFNKFLDRDVMDFDVVWDMFWKIARSSTLC